MRADRQDSSCCWAHTRRLRNRLPPHGVVLRLRRCKDARRQKCTHPEPDRRTHARVPADSCRATLEFGEGHRSLGRCDGDEGSTGNLRSDSGPEFVAKDLRRWLADTGAKTLFIEPGSPSENGYCESLNSKLTDEFLNGEIFYSIKELRVLIDRWPVHYRPTTLLTGYKPPAPEAWLTQQARGESVSASHDSSMSNRAASVLQTKNILKFSIMVECLSEI